MGETYESLLGREHFRKVSTEQILDYIFDGGDTPQMALEFFDSDQGTLQQLLIKVLERLKLENAYNTDDKNDTDTPTGRYYEIAGLYAPIPPRY